MPLDSRSRIVYILSNDAGWSSPVAREAHNLEVVGSNPAPATSAPRSYSITTEGFFHAPAERRGRLSAEIARVCDLPSTFGVSARTSRATRRIHALGPLTPRFQPNLSAVSMSRAVWVKMCWLPLFRSQPTVVGFGWL